MSVSSVNESGKTSVTVNTSDVQLDNVISTIDPSIQTKYAPPVMDVTVEEYDIINGPNNPQIVYGPPPTNLEVTSAGEATGEKIIEDIQNEQIIYGPAPGGDLSVITPSEGTGEKIVSDLQNEQIIYGPGVAPFNPNDQIIQTTPYTPGDSSTHQV